MCLRNNPGANRTSVFTPVATGVGTMKMYGIMSCELENLLGFLNALIHL